MTHTPSQEEENWEKEFDIREAKIWQFAGLHPDFKNHTSEMVKQFIRDLLHTSNLSLIQRLRGEVGEDEEWDDTFFFPFQKSTMEGRNQERSRIRLVLQAEEERLKANN